MIIDRRCFLQGAAFAASAMIFAKELPPLSPKERVAQTADRNPDCDPVIFKIAGWDNREGARDEIVISINHSWRTAWR